MTFFTKLKPIELPVEYSKLASGGRYIVRQQYIVEQKGLCYHCKGDLTLVSPEHVRRMKVDPGLYPDGFFDNPIHLHHDHNTGLTIGVVHAYCNAVLWEYHNE